ncbi:MAG TPA: threonine/serine dehydratase [Chloroflexota bacterium]|nr:threonine/serine dehydratase [Chloroflexota bacterium]
MLPGREPTLDDVRVAAERLRGVVVHTPLLYPATPGFPLAGAVILKPENLQVTGSFKPRGAYNKLASLTPQERARSVVAFSSGNHAQGVAYAARLLGVTATIVMPDNAVPAKLAATRALGAEVVQVGTTSQHRLEYGMALARERGAALVPSYDDPLIIAGQGTIGLEILEDCPDVEAVVVPTGGGGMLSGIALALRSQQPNVRIIGVEPAGAADAQASLRAGQLVTWEHPDTLADGLRVTHLGNLPFALITRFVDDIVTVTDDEIRAAVLALHRGAKLVVEPSGAVAMAALMHEKTGVEGRRTVAVLSGGNVDPALLARWLAEE